MAVDFSRENLSSLTRDGISEELFKLLWAKDELNFSPNINIPDTILYKHGQPAAWYFTSTDGRIKRKNKNNLVSSKIEQAFNKHILGYDVIAYFISMPSELDMNKHHEIPTLIEYFDRAALNNFLYNHKKDANGLLQRFIEPKTTHNEVIRAIWSPKLCLLERAENKHALHDNRYGLYERTVVYEGPEYYYTAEPLRGPVLSGQIQKMCEAIIAHIGEVTYGQKQVSRIVLNFKVDSRDKIWFMYSTSIRSMDMLEYNPLSGGDTMRRSLVNIDSVVSLADTIHLNPKKTYNKIMPKSLKTCLSCAKETLEDTRHSVTYKQIMKHYEHVLLILQSSSSAFHGNKKEGTVIWPPDAEVLQATGNVGFGCMQLDNDEEFRPNTSSSNHLHSHSAPSTAQGGSHHHRRGTTLKHKKIRDVLIPPILSYLHTKLTPETFERCKSDPLFQNKTVMVCEDCYLVYAEFATMMLRMGENLKKLLLPDARSLDGGNSSMMSGTSTANSSHAHRPSSADWRAISTAALSTANDGERGLHGVSRGGDNARAIKQELAAKERAIGLRTSDTRHQPTLPSMVRSASESAATLQHVTQNHQNAYSRGVGGGHSVASSSTSDFNHQYHTNNSSSNNIHHANMPFNGGRLEQDSLLSGSQHHTQQQHTGEPTEKTFTYDPQAVHSLIAERERQFFKEIALNPQLRDHHPLQHLLHAQQKLKLVDEQSGVLLNKAAQQSESIFGTQYGRQASDQHDRYNMYATEVPYAMHGEVILPSQLKIRTRQQQEAKRRKKQEALQRFLEQQRKDEEAQMELLHRQMKEKEATDKALASQQQQQQLKMKKAGSTVPMVDPAVVSSQHYRDFLKDSLHKIGGEMQHAQAASQSGAVLQARQELAEEQQQQHGPGQTHGGSSRHGLGSGSGSGSHLQHQQQQPQRHASMASTATAGSTAGATSATSATSAASTQQPQQQQQLQRTASSTSVLSSTSSLSQQSPVSKSHQQQQQQQSSLKNSSQKKAAASPSPTKTPAPGNANNNSKANAHAHTNTVKTSKSSEAAALPSAKYQKGFLANHNNNSNGNSNTGSKTNSKHNSTNNSGNNSVVPAPEQEEEQAAQPTTSETKTEAEAAADAEAEVAAGTAAEAEVKDDVSAISNPPSVIAATFDQPEDQKNNANNTDNVTTDVTTNDENDRLVPGGQREDQEEEEEEEEEGVAADGDNKDVANQQHHIMEDQLSVDQSSLGQSVIDAPANNAATAALDVSVGSQQQQQWPAAAAAEGSIASIAAEDSVATSSAHSMIRQQTDALLQLASSESASVTDSKASAAVVEPTTAPAELSANDNSNNSNNNSNSEKAENSSKKEDENVEQLSEKASSSSSQKQPLPQEEKQDKEEEKAGHGSAAVEDETRVEKDQE